LHVETRDGTLQPRARAAGSASALEDNDRRGNSIRQAVDIGREATPDRGSCLLGPDEEYNARQKVLRTGYLWGWRDTSAQIR